MLRQLTTIFALVSSQACHALGAEVPLATIAVVSNPYITTLPPDQIKDENGRLREFIAKTGPDACSKAVNLINRLKPDVT
ncbi:MAG: hypothetical protein MK324_18460, partial [Pirellulales bacterium]|nr:hypothetical protein [Pirellulales bacterium]